MNMYADKVEMAIETKIKPNLMKIYDLKIQGLKDKYIAQALGISEKVFQEAIGRYKPLSDIYNDAMNLLCGQLTDIVVKRALGTDGRLDEKGVPLPPDEKLAFKLLEKFDNRFAAKPDVAVNLTIEQVIKGISEKKKQAEIEMKEDEDI